MSSALFSPGAPNLGLHSFPVYLTIAALPHWYTIYLALKHKVNGGWDNRQPRSYVAALAAKQASGKKLTDLEGVILRGQAAQQNGFEWFALYAAGILAANQAHLPASVINKAAALGLVTRLIYNYLYVTTTTKPLSFVRTLVFWVHAMTSIKLLVQAGQVLK